MLIICDFDGTVTARDTNSALARRYAPERYAQIEGRLARREVTVRETLAHEFEGLDVRVEELVRDALDIPIRAGFRTFVDALRSAGHRFVLLSSGFRQIIEPILAREGFEPGELELHANDLCDSSGGLRIGWRQLPMCSRCDEHCKRHEVNELRERANLEPGGDVTVFIGDGFSDRCGADVADIIFARDSLARWLDERGIAWRAWEDFHDIAHALELTGAEQRA